MCHPSGLATPEPPCAAAPDRSSSLVAAVALLGGLVACGGSDDDGADADRRRPRPRPATTGADRRARARPRPELPDPYDGHTSEVYDDGAAWICRPDLDDDACRDLDVTTVAADGPREVEEREPADDPPVDCFYVYPTVSQDPGVNSDMEVGPDDNETTTVIAQAAQFARTCRVFAPIYRQVTLAGPRLRRRSRTARPSPTATSSTPGRPTSPPGTRAGA